MKKTKNPGWKITKFNAGYSVSYHDERIALVLTIEEAQAIVKRETERDEEGT